MVFLQEFIGRIIDSPVPVYALALNICIVEIEVDYRMPEIPDSDAVAAERAVA